MKQIYLPTEEGFFKTVNEYLSSADIETCHLCFSQLKHYLGTAELNPFSIREWINSDDGYEMSDLLSFRKMGAALMIQEYMDFAFHSRGNKVPFFSNHLSLEFYHLACLYTNEKTDISNSGRWYRSTYAAKVLRIFQCHDVNTLADINYQLIYACCNEISTGAKEHIAEMHSALNGLLSILCIHQPKAYGYLLLVQLITCSGDHPDSWLHMDKKLLDTLKEEEVEMPQVIMPLSRLLLVRDEISQQIDNQISVKIRCTFTHVINQLYVFLDFNDFSCYTPHIGEAWLDHFINTAQPYLRRKNQYKRGLDLLNTRYNDLEIDLAKRRGRISIIMLLPEWCREIVNNYLMRKQNEKLDITTVCMIRSSICRFLFYADKNGCRSFMDITPDLLHRFVIDDPHDTPEGKNAYLVRIRHFLEYLEEINLVKTLGLYLALPSVCIRRERKVEILSEEEQQLLNSLLEPECETLSKRGKAILLLGLEMGLRRIDITELRITDISFERQILTIMQEKTQYEIQLAIPTHVMNALYQYIMIERPESIDQHIFLTTNKPYRPLNPSTCAATIGTAIPERNSQSHILRKTHASNALNNGATLDEVIELLGHRDRTTIHKYLSLDEKRMKQCAISLEEYGIKGGRFEWIS